MHRRMCCKIIKLKLHFSLATSRVNPCMAERPDKVRQINIGECVKYANYYYLLSYVASAVKLSIKSDDSSNEADTYKRYTL